MRTETAAFLLAALASSCSAQVCSPGWEPFEPGLNGSSIMNLHVFDDGTGPVLYAAGYLDGDGFISGFARFDADSWIGINGGPFLAYEIATFDDGTGPALYVGGDSSSSSTIPSNRGVAKWNGKEWEALGEGVTSSGAVLSMLQFENGLFVAGGFSSVDGFDTGGLARWSGSEWADASAGLEFTPWALCVHDDGSGASLYAAGREGTDQDNLVGHVARWDGEQWIDLNLNANNAVVELVSFDDGTGPALYAGGWFTEVDGEPTGHILRWNGAVWEPLPADLPGRVKRLSVLDTGEGPTLYASGLFSFAPDQEDEYVATWDGFEWHPIPNSGPGLPTALVVYDRGDGPRLTASGLFRLFGEGGPLDWIATLGCVPEDCPGDANGDNRTDLTDLNIVLANFGSDAEQADLNDDGVVDITDLNLVLSSFGAICD